MAVVVGCGIVGLYTAYELHKNEPVVVVANHFPGDLSINYTSPWAGADFSFASGDDPRNWEFDRVSYEAFDSIARELGPECGIAVYKTIDYWKDSVPDQGKVAHLQQYVRDFRVLAKDELPSDVTYGVTFTTYNLNPTKLLPALVEYLKRTGKVTFVRRKLCHVSEAFQVASPVLSGHTRVVFNCTGIGAYSLPGVEDKHVYPIRGQVVVVKPATRIDSNYTYNTTDGVVTYIIPRAGPEGHVVLGGTYEPGNWDGNSYSYQTEGILTRTAKLFPPLKNCQFVSQHAGLRPGRRGGVRIEFERTVDGILVHNYGAGGFGYQSGYGMAREAVRKAGEARGSATNANLTKL